VLHGQHNRTLPSEKAAVVTQEHKSPHLQNEVLVAARTKRCRDERLRTP